MNEAPFEILARGFRFCEAPRALANGAVSFSDLVGGGYYLVNDVGALRTILPDRMWIGGATLDLEDAYLLGGKGGLVLVDSRGMMRSILSDIAGRPIIAINDIEADSSGAIYGGTIDFAAILERGETPEHGLFFRLTPSGELTVLREGVVASNGIGFSPDGKTLYHSESTVGVWAWSLSEGIVHGTPLLFAAADDCDGLVVDVEGYVWVAFWREAVLRRYRADATVDRVVPLPFPNVVNLAFGGPDMTHLYVTTGASLERPDAGGLIRLRNDVPGLPAHRSAFNGAPHGS